MPETSKVVVPSVTNYICDKCGTGTMILHLNKTPTSAGMLHTCNNAACNNTALLPKAYPFISYK